VKHPGRGLPSHRAAGTAGSRPVLGRALCAFIGVLLVAGPLVPGLLRTDAGGGGGASKAPSIERRVPGAPGEGTGEGAGAAGGGPGEAPAWAQYPYIAGPFDFPVDEGAHQQAAEEWWYVNGHLMGDGGEVYDFMVCFFDQGIVAAALYDGASGRYLNYSGMWRDAIKETGRLGLDYGGNVLYQIEGRPFEYRLACSFPEFGLALELAARKVPLVVNGDGYIRMGRGLSSYYALTDLSVKGSLSAGSVEVAVSGAAWMDRQWGAWSPSLDWDWLSIKLDNGMDVLAYRMYLDGAGFTVTQLASVMDADGNSYNFNQSPVQHDMVVGYSDYWRSPGSHRLYSSGWDIFIPGIGLALSLAPERSGQELSLRIGTDPATRVSPFWEGACKVSGTYQGQPVAGRAFVETTYDYGDHHGDLVVTPKRYSEDGDHGELVVLVENTAGYPLDNVEVRLTVGDPRDGGAYIATYDVDSPRNSTYLRERLPELGFAPIYITVDPDNRFAETNEANNIAVAVPD